MFIQLIIFELKLFISGHKFARDQELALIRVVNDDLLSRSGKMEAISCFSNNKSCHPMGSFTEKKLKHANTFRCVF